MVERIKAVQEYSQMSAGNFASTIGISRSALTHLFSGRNQPSLDIVTKILNTFPEISTEWLLHGRGDMLRNSPAVSTPQEIVAETNPVPRQQPDLFSVFDEPSAPETVPEIQVEREPETATEPESLQQNSKSQQPSKRATKRNAENKSSDRKLVKIVMFYSDNSFVEYTNSDVEI